MVVGVPKEIKVGEQRVALTPAGARAFTGAGHRVLVEANAGGGSGFPHDDYARAGAVVTVADGVWSQAELVLKVKEPLPEEVARTREGQILFTYLHLAAVPELIRGLQARKCIAIAYETVARADGSLPLLTPMSEVAGRLAVQEGAHHLGEAYGGRGILLSGIPGVPHGNVAILGAGTVGLNATKMALGYGADVSLLDINLDRLRHADDIFGGRVITIASNRYNIEQVLQRTDLLIGAVLIAGARAPVLVTEAMIKSMKPGAVVVDVAVDQGGCVETIRPTTVVDPVYTVHGVLHYGVTNMPRPRAAHVDLRADERHLALCAAARRAGTAGRRAREPRAGPRRQHLARPHRLSRRGCRRGRDAPAPQRPPLRSWSPSVSRAFTTCGRR